MQHGITCAPPVPANVNNHIHNRRDNVVDQGGQQPLSRGRLSLRRCGETCGGRSIDEPQATVVISVNHQFRLDLINENEFKVCFC